jgi:hypothetical protein
VHPNAYGVRAAWDGLQPALDRAALLRTSTGRLILCLEADATHAESALTLDHAAQVRGKRSSFLRHFLSSCATQTRIFAKTCSGQT